MTRTVWNLRGNSVACGPLRRAPCFNKSVLCKRRTLVLRAEPDPSNGAIKFNVCSNRLDYADPRTFDEGAAQVRRLMQRDRTRFSGPDFEDLMEKQFAEDTTNDQVTGEPQEDPPTKPMEVSSTKPVSPFGGAVKTSAVSPFESSVKTPFDEPDGLVLDRDYQLEIEEEEPWWNFINNITGTQIALACSFLLITLTMLGTFAFVFKSGGIHFNE